MSKFISWIDRRLPVSNFIRNHLSQYYAPKNFNFFYFFGALAIFVFILQIVTGIFLTINYKPDADQAFASVEYIMRDVEWGWLIRYMHSTGASFFFISFICICSVQCCMAHIRILESYCGYLVC